MARYAAFVRLSDLHSKHDVERYGLTGPSPRARGEVKTERLP
jgi:hypothetical protein